ncbi:AsmA family protein [Hymenobacter elongatus]|uniref:hypothetical protein n=1 Tax=Hymenobacter elongatus TaxID=877208 RepID=UPI001AEBB77A|nr:hypothetical protein [Hymenobacter elongatus]
MPTGKKPGRWRYWTGGMVLSLLLLVGIAVAFLDPWLRRMLEKQVAEQSQGRYQLRIGELHTSLWSRAMRIQNIELRPAKNNQLWQQTTLPRLLATIEEVRISGVGLGALLRGTLVPIDTVRVAGLRLRALQLPKANPNAKPLHEQLPARIPGLRIGYVSVLNVRAAYGSGRVPQTSVRRASFTAQDVLLSAAGATDTLRLGYASSFGVQVSGALGTVAEHRLRVGAVRYSSQRQQLTVDSLRVWSLRAMEQPGPVVRVRLALPHLRLTGLSAQALRRREVRLDSVSVVKPWLAATPPTQPPPALHHVLASYLRHVAVAHLRVSGGTLRLLGIRAKPQVQDIRLGADDMLVTAAGATDASRIWYARSWELRTGRVQTAVSAPVYWLGLQGTELITRTGVLRATGITLRPTMTPTALARYKRHQTPHITVRAPVLAVTGLDFGALTRRGALLARQVEVRNVRVLIAGDGRFPLNPKFSMVTQESLAKLPVRLNVRRVVLANSSIGTSYIGPKTQREGSITFNRINATLTNLTNDPRLMTAAAPLVGQASGWLQNSWNVRIAVRIPLLDPAGAHSGEGTFGPGSITLLNTMTEPTRLARFESGTVRRATVRFTGNRQQITGTMRAEYSDLKLALLSQAGGPDQKTLLTKVGSTLLNGIVIRDQNPRGLGPDKLKLGSMQSRRDQRVSVFSLWRQGLVSGLLNSIGAPQKLAQTISEQP